MHRFHLFLLTLFTSFSVYGQQSPSAIESVIASERVRKTFPIVIGLNSAMSTAGTCNKSRLTTSRPNFCEFGQPGDPIKTLQRARSFCQWSSELESENLNFFDEDNSKQSQKNSASFRKVVANLYSPSIQTELQNLQKLSGADIIDSLQQTSLSKELVQVMAEAHKSISVAGPPTDQLPFTNRNGGSVKGDPTQLDYSPSYRIQVSTVEGRRRMYLFVAHEMAHAISHPVRDRLLQAKIGNQTLMQCLADQFQIPPPPQGANWLMEPRFSEAIADILGSVAVGNLSDQGRSTLQWQTYIRENLSSQCEALNKLETLTESEISQLHQSSTHPPPWVRIESLMKNKKIREKVGCSPIGESDGVCGLY